MDGSHIIYYYCVIMLSGCVDIITIFTFFQSEHAESLPEEIELLLLKYSRKNANQVQVGRLSQVSSHITLFFAIRCHRVVIASVTIRHFHSKGVLRQQLRYYHVCESQIVVRFTMFTIVYEKSNVANDDLMLGQCRRRLSNITPVLFD